jgi:hypothetical protein
MANPHTLADPPITHQDEGEHVDVVERDAGSIDAKAGRVGRALVHGVLDPVNRSSSANATTRPLSSTSVAAESCQPTGGPLRPRTDMLRGSRVRLHGVCPIKSQPRPRYGLREWATRGMW